MIHRRPPFIVSSERHFWEVCTEFDSGEVSRRSRSLARNGHHLVTKARSCFCPEVTLCGSHDVKIQLLTNSIALNLAFESECSRVSCVLIVLNYCCPVEIDISDNQKARLDADESAA